MTVNLISPRRAANLLGVSRQALDISVLPALLDRGIAVRLDGDGPAVIIEGEGWKQALAFAGRKTRSERWSSMGWPSTSKGQVTVDFHIDGDEGIAEISATCYRCLACGRTWREKTEEMVSVHRDAADSEGNHWQTMSWRHMPAWESIQPCAECNLQQ